MGEWGKQEIIHGGKGNTKVHPHGKGVHASHELQIHKFIYKYTDIVNITPYSEHKLSLE